MQKAQSIGEILAEYIQGTALEQPLLERKVVEVWPEVLGSAVAQLTWNIRVKDGVLYVHIQSAALRAQLFECRYTIVQKINAAVQADVLKDIRLLG